MSKAPHSPFPLLKNEQARASHPDERVWLSASAGTGKTQVLTARVLRLLLRGVSPESILCLTFTKAGASEMKERINERLGKWVRLSRPELHKDLENLGEPGDDAAVAHARTLFARVLDARGGGLRIQTIHSFCQSLLGSFPAEAGLIPGFRPIEGREEKRLQHTTLADMVSDAERGGQLGTIDRLQALAARLGEDGARAFLGRCAAAPDAMADLGVGIEAKVRRWLGLGDVDPEALLLAACTDGGFDEDSVHALRALNMEWGTKTAMKRVEVITEWLSLPPELRLKYILDLTSVWAKADGDIRSFGKGQAPQDSEYAIYASDLFSFFNGLLELRTLAQTAQDLASALAIGQDYARAYADAKRATGAVDFNDMIRATVALLAQPDIGPWISYKLDQATDHVLIDEAQDTNAAQWEIVKALTGEFFAGEGAKGNMRRTLFVVGDYKQAIFGFQGTDPNEFNLAREHFDAAARQANQNLLDLSLASSFRSGPPVLELVDATLDGLGHEALGLPRPDPAHISARGGSGSVTLLPPVSGIADGDEEGDVEGDEEQWLGDAELTFARDLAERVKGWTSGAQRLRLRNRGDQPAEPEDVLILLRSRGEMARLIVSRLIEAGVPVAGVDRLRLNAPIVVMDLLACMRFVLQPLDDLNLASLLVSPLIGWTQDTLYERAKGRRGDLWGHLGESKPEPLRQMLGMADQTTPHRFLEAILSGPMRGRAKLIATLGEEARDPVEELLNAALAFERDAPPSLQLFLDWFDRGDVEIKRDPSKPERAVRVMTVHGAKGLQAPIVVLADATRDPDFNKPRDLNWIAEEGLTLPVFRPRKPELVGSLRESAEVGDAKRREEHWRELYVALTRAEEHLFIGGALTPKQRKGMGPDCWHMRVGEALRALGATSDGAGALIHAGAGAILPAPKGIRDGDGKTGDLPSWLSSAAPEEARPPRPLAPSKLEGDDTEASPPPDPRLREAARRGIRLHALFERLPSVAADRREAVADHWLAQSEGVADAAARAELVSAALAVIDDPQFAALFGPDSLAEAPLAGVVGERVISGTVDRLLISADEILVVDFKTGRRVPASATSAPEQHKAQMAAYAAVLSGIFPDHSIRAALLYTSGPKLITLDAATLTAHKPGYRDQQDKLPAAG